MGYWKFAVQNRIEEVSFNPVLERFYGYGINGLIRENIQNSLDGKLPDSDLPVEVIIEKGEIETRLIPGIDEIKERIKVLYSHNIYANDTIKHMHNKLDQEVVNYISFEDRNTKGLRGATEGYCSNSENTYSAYAYSKGIHITDNNSEVEKSRGGSHGIGKIASNAASDLYVMYFANCDEYGNKHLGGTAQLVEHSYEGSVYRATGYFTDETDNNHYFPYENKFDKVFTKDTRGLKIVIPYLRENFNDDKEIVRAICDNFFLSIYQNKLKVKYNGVLIDKENIETIIYNADYYEQDLEKMKDVFTPLYLDTYLNKEKFEISIFDGNKDKYDFNLYFQYDTSILKGRVAVIRTIGMKIEDRKILNCATKPFNAVLIPKDSDGDSFLKSLENESHSELSVDHIKDFKEQKNSKKFLNNLSTEIRKILDDFIRKNNPVDGKIDTKDIIYDVENKFKTELKANTKIVKLSQSVEEKPIVKYDTKKKKEDKKEKDKTEKNKDDKEKKPAKKVKKTDKDNVTKQFIKVHPHMVRRFIHKDKEFLNINLSGEDVKNRPSLCNLMIKVIDGQGKERDNELNINTDYKAILDVQSGNLLSSEGEYIKNISWKQQIKDILDETIVVSKSYDEFMEIVKSRGIEVKEGKYISFRLEKLGQERFTRGKTLGADYTEEQLKSRIEERNRSRSKFRKLAISPQKVKGNLSGKKKKLYTLEQQLYYKSRNDKYREVKDLAETILLLRNEKIDRRSDIDIRIKELNTQAGEINRDIKALEKKSKSFNEVAKYLNTYNKYKDLYSKYETTVFNKNNFYRKNEGEILSFEHAKSQLEKLNIDLNTDINKVLESSKEFNSEIDNISKDFKQLQDRISKIRDAEKKIDEVLGNKNITEKERHKDIER